MKYFLKILRGTGAGESRWQRFSVEDSGGSSVAHALDTLNARPVLRDCSGAAAEPVAWDCACLEKKCGACAMRISAHPALACAVSLDAAADAEGEITLEPLRKFPRIRDLRVDRSGMFDALRDMELWLETHADLAGDRQREMHYRAASCLMCGLCLEVCPNFDTGSRFAGAMGALASFRALDLSGPGAHRGTMRRQYLRRFFNTCAKSLSCQEICPMKIPVEQLLVRTNAAAVWHRGGGKKQ